METILQAIEDKKAILEQTSDYIWEHAETGYREWKSSAYMENVFEKTPMFDTGTFITVIVLLLIIGASDFFIVKAIKDNNELKNKKLHVPEDEQTDSTERDEPSGDENESTEPQDEAPEPEKEEKAQKEPKEKPKKKKESKYGRDYDKSRYNKKI